MNGQLLSDDTLETGDHNEISKLIHLLILRVECLSNEKRTKKRKKRKESHPTVAEVDHSLIEYLYYLFKKFIDEDSTLSSDLKASRIDKNNFVTVCQALVHNGCFDLSSATISPSPNQSLSEATNSSEYTLTQPTSRHEEQSDNNETSIEVSPTDDPTSLMISMEKESWLLEDFDINQSKEVIGITGNMVSCNFVNNYYCSRGLLTHQNKTRMCF